MTQKRKPEPREPAARDAAPAVEVDDLDDPGDPPAPAAPPPAAAKPARAARVIDPRERAAGGTVRYKVRATSHPPAPQEYVLAGDEAAARACYRKACGLPPEAVLVVVTLPD